MEFARPGLLVAGALTALVPLVLHLISRRPPDRQPLPTARFLRPDPRTRLRLDRRPTDLPLLLLRILFVLLLFAAFAGPERQPPRAGTVELVLLERTRAMAPVWADAVDEVRGRILGEDGRVRAGLVLFDTTTTVLEPTAVHATLLDSLAAAAPGPDAPPRADYAAAFTGLREAARALPDAESAHVTIITRAAWEAWSPALPALRRTAWPGTIELVDLGYGLTESRAVLSPVPPSPRAVVLGEGADGGRYVEAALGALGWTVTRRQADSAGAVWDEVGEAPAELIVLLDAPPDDTAAPLLTRVRDHGATLVVAAAWPAGPLGEALPWQPGVGQTAADQPVADPEDTALNVTRRGIAAQIDALAGPDPDATADLVLDSRLRLTAARPVVAGAPVPNARWLGVWADGQPAAAAAAHGSGCLVYLNAALEAGRLPLSEAFPAAVQRLARGCEPPANGAPGGVRAQGPLDEAARAVLRGEDLPAAAALAPLAGGRTGRPLFVWFLIAAGFVALAETAAAYRQRRGG